MKKANFLLITSLSRLTMLVDMEQIPWNSISVGQKIRFHRLGAALSLEELASRAQLSASYLSKIERGRSNPAMENLERICGALHMSFDQLLTKPPLVSSAQETVTPERAANLRPTLVRASERMRILLPRSELSYELLTPDLQRTLQFTLVRHPPHHESPVFEHEGEESMFCLSGCLRAVVGQEQFVLSAGDCLSFSSSTPHQIINESSAEAVLISVNTPTSF